LHIYFFNIILILILFESRRITFVKYKDGMSLLSQCGLGAILISEDYNIIDVNEIGTGGFSIMEDYSKINKLNKQVIELQKYEGGGKEWITNIYM